MNWILIPRQGFIGRHWIANTPDGRRFSVWQSIAQHGRRGRRIVTAYLVGPDRIRRDFPNVPAAKKAAEDMIKEQQA